MAYEGLFGIGDAGNLNNRDLVKESRDIENHLQDVARFKEEQKRNEELRAKRRRENRDDLYDQYYEGGEIHVNYQPYIAGKVKGHHQWITENMDENGNIKDESLAEYRRREDQILQDVTALKDRTTDYNATVNDMRTEGTDINLYKRSGDGTYLVDFHEKAFLEGLKNGKINPNLPVNLPSMKGTPEPKKGSADYIEKEKKGEGILSTKDERVAIANNIETTTSYYTDKKIDLIENEMYEQLNPNELYLPNGQVAKSTWIVDYMDQSNQTRFFEEENTKGIDSPEVLDPKSDAYNSGLADQYAKWLAKDLTKDLRKEEIINKKYVEPKTIIPPNDLKTYITQTDLDLYNDPQPSDVSRNGFVVALDTDVPVTLNKHKATVKLRESDIYSTPNQGQVFLDENGQQLKPIIEDGKEISVWEQIAGSIDSSSGEDVSINATLEATMQLENGDFVGLYSLNGSNHSVLVPFSKMNEGTFKVTGNEQPSEHLKQFEYWRRRNELTDSTTPTGDPTEGSGNADAFDPFNPEKFKVSAYGGGNAPTTEGTIKMGGGEKEYTFENPLSQEDHEILWDSGVRKIVWKSVPKGGKDGQPSYSTRGILTIPYRTHMDPKSKDFNPGSMFTMDDILAIIQSEK